jgi:ribonucleoside-diphosphate reductase alpha chain
MAKEGSTISGFADSFSQAISYALQYGVPLQVLVDKFSHARFEPSGMTRNPDIRFAKSIVDYIFRWLATKFLSQEAQYHAGVNNRDERRTEERPAAAPSTSAAQPSRAVSEPKTGSRSTSTPATYAAAAIQNQEDAPPCSSAGRSWWAELLQVRELRIDGGA